MEKYIHDERNGLWYQKAGDYYLPCFELPKQEQAIGVWGIRHRQFLKENKAAIYEALLLTGKLNGYLADIDRQAQEMFDNLCQELAENWNITEDQKANDPIHWIRGMNSVRSTAREIVDEELIYV